MGRTGPGGYVAESRAPRLAGTRIRGSADVHEACRRQAGERVEVVRVLLLSARHDVLRRVTVSRGTVQASLVHPREVFRPAILASAAAVVVVHNHPSGDPEPSADDLEVTRRLASAGEILGIELVDHVIVARGGRFVSLRERGVL